ncbi:MAG: ribonuclease P protein component [Saonia sp.]
MSKNSKFSFPKKEKLKNKKLIERLFQEGKSLSKYPLKLIYIKTTFSEDVKIRAGVTVPKKNFKSAVRRNRIKRLMRESYRLNKHLVFNNIEGNFAFLFLYLGKDLPSQQLVEESMVKILQKFIIHSNDEKVD